MSKLKPPSRAALRRQFKPYALAIGELNLAWNQLHERLAMLFWNAIGNNENGAPSLAIWNFLTSDKTQRDLLKVAIDAGAFDHRYNGQQASEDVLWLLSKIQTLSEKRNNAIHAPLVSVTGQAGTRIEPHVSLENRRAKNLKGKDLLKEFGWYRETAESLSVFAAEMHYCLSFPKLNWTWPKRPALPSLGDQKTPKERNLSVRRLARRSRALPQSFRA
jgi:hypothetical protein